MFRLLLLVFFGSVVIRFSDCHGDEDEGEDEKHIGSKFKEPIVILISFDGFRYDYLDRLKTLKKDSMFWKIISNGGIYDSDGMATPFAPITFPNHYTLATGLYQENHGIIANSIYDRSKNLTFNLKQNSESSKYLYGGEPIWTTIRRKSKVACFMWVGCQFGNLDNFVPYKSIVQWSQVVDQILQWLNKDVQLMTIYWTEPDRIGHGTGPNSFEMNQTLVEIDDQLEDLLNKIQLKNKWLRKNVNFIFTSDHGMTDIVGQVIIPLRPDLYTVEMQETTFWHVRPVDGKLKETIKHFQQFSEHLEVYEKENIPDHWHYKNNDKIGAVLVVAKLGYVLVVSEWNLTKSGAHGYNPDNSESRGFFVATGPAFNKIANKSVNVANTDIYLMICKIFGVQPSPNNGSEIMVASILNQSYLNKTTKSFPANVSLTNLWIVVITSTAVVLFVFIIYFTHRANFEKGKQRFHVSHVSTPLNGTSGFIYRKIPNEQSAPLLSNKTLEHSVDDSDNDSI